MKLFGRSVSLRSPIVADRLPPKRWLCVGEPGSDDVGCERGLQRLTESGRCGCGGRLRRMPV